MVSEEYKWQVIRKSMEVIHAWKNYGEAMKPSNAPSTPRYFVEAIMELEELLNKEGLFLK